MFLPVIALATSIGTAIYVARKWRRVKMPITTAERVCQAWNEWHQVGGYVVYEPEPFDPAAGNVAVRTISNAYVKDGRAVIDIERFNTVELNRIYSLQRERGKQNETR